MEQNLIVCELSPISRHRKKEGENMVNKKLDLEIKKLKKEQEAFNIKPEQITDYEEKKQQMEKTFILIAEYQKYLSDYNTLLLKYPIYWDFIEKELQNQSIELELEEYDFEAIRILKNYISFFEITEGPKVLSLEEKTRIIDFIGFYENKAAEKGEIVNTHYPVNYITPIDKLSNKLFAGELSEKLKSLAMERRGSKNQINTFASIDFDTLDSNVQITGVKELTAYDRQVHDAIITLYIEGANSHITPQMIFQVMTGDPKARITPRQTKLISNSSSKFLHSKITIDATQDAKAYGFDKFKYEGNLISGEKVTATLNGTPMECLRILRTPILYEYANKKNQIGRFDIKLLDTPINKNEEVIILQGYLFRRILSIKGSSKLSHKILYETVFKQINMTTSSDGALRKKKLVVRKHVKSILNYWKEKNFIKDYKETPKGQEIVSLSIIT